MAGLVEYFCRSRPALRVAFYEITSWIFNFFVLIYLTTLAICLTILGPMLTIHPS